MTVPPSRLAGDAGQVGGIEVLPFGFLVFISVTLLLANAWAVIDSKLATTSASREAVRTFVEAADEATATEQAIRRADETLRAFGRGGDRSRTSTLSHRIPMANQKKREGRARTPSHHFYDTISS